MKLTIHRKVLIGFGIVILLMLVANAYVLVELRWVTRISRSALTVDVQAIDLAKQMRTILYEEERYAQKYLIAHDAAYRAIFLENNRLFVRYQDSLGSMLSDQGERHLLELAGEEHAWHFTAVSEAHRADPAINEKARSDAMDKVHQALDELITRRQHSVDVSVANLGEATQRSLQVALLIAIGTLIAAIVVAFIIARTITKPIGTLVEGTRVIAGGSYTRIRIPSHDEIADLAQAFNAMSESLDEVNRFRAEMMQHISHELRMPLQTMLSAYYLLTRRSEEVLSARQLKLLDGIRENVDKIANFSNQFLDLSKVEAGMMEYNTVPVDLTTIVKPVVDGASLIATRKEIALTFVASPAPSVWADPDKCTEVVGNLVSNALKYTENGGKVDISVGPSPLGAQVVVRDTGPGIPEADLSKIFTKFYRTSTAVKGRTKGTGIGLAFVKALVEGQGGRVYASSTVGVGSTFTVEFPTGRPGERHTS